MKNTIRKSAFVVFMFVTLIGYANENINKVKVEFNFVKKGEVLTIKNNEDATIYEQTITNAGKYSKSFDLTALENGTYSAELDKAFEIKIKPFTILNGVVNFLEERTILKPTFKIEKDVLSIFKTAFEKESLEITIYFKNEVILSETLENKNSYKRAYKLLSTEKGNYKVVINSKDRMYVKDFKL